MKLYKKTSNNTVWAFESDGSQDQYITQDMVPITEAEADAIRNPPAQIRDTLVASAKTALDVSDMVCLRCYKAGVAFPSTWQTWTQELRNIVNGTDVVSTSLPTQPTYPSGT